MKIRVRLVSTPTDNNVEAIRIASEIDNSIFPGCDTPRFKEAYLWLAYTEDNEVAGFASLRPFLRGKFGFLERVAVLPKYRGNRLQKRFIRARLSLARKLNMKSVVTYTVPDNVESINSLMHSGFYAFTPGWKWAGANMLYFIFDLR